MVRYIYILFLGILYSQDIDISIDRNRIYEGESIVLTITAKNGDSPDIDLSLIKDFSIVSGPNNSTSMEWINGNVTTIHSISWTLMPKRIGKLFIPGLKININNNQYRTEKIEVSVLKHKKIDKNLNIDRQYFIEASIDNNNPYRGEQIILTYTLYTKVNLSSFDFTKLPVLKGFWSQDLYAPKNLQFREVNLNGNRWYTAIVKQVALFPTKSGKINITPANVIIGVKTGNRNKNLNFFNDNFFGDIFGRTKQVNLSTNSLFIDVKSLPMNKGKTSAAIGEWRVYSSIDRKIVKQDEAITLTITIKGTGNLKSVDIEDIVFPSFIEIFEPEIIIKENPLRDKLGGEKKIEYVLIPRMEGDLIIPSVGLTYFDLKEEKWKTKKSKKINITVQPNERSISTSIGLSKEEVELIGSDIRFSNLNVPKWFRISNYFITTKLIFFNFISIILFFIPMILEYRKIHLESTKDYRKAKYALKLSLMEFKNIDLNSNEINYNKIHSSLNIFISNKLNQHIQRSSKDIIETSKKYIQNENIINNLLRTLNNVDAIRYGTLDKYNFNNDLSSIKKLLNDMEKNWI